MKLAPGALVVVLLAWPFLLAKADVVVTANVKSLTKQAVSGRAYFQFDVLNCSLAPMVAGAALDITRYNQVPVADDGTISTTLYRNDEIDCDGTTVSNTSASLWSNGKRVWYGVFHFQDATANLATYSRVTVAPPAPVPNYAIRNGDNTFSPGTTQVFTGVTTIGLTASSSTRKFLPAGAIDGVNAVFTFGAIPVDHTQFLLYRNGMLLEDVSDYSISGNTVTMITVPKTGDKLAAYF